MHAGTDGAGAPLPAVIAIDGPTASGKGTIAQRLADRLGWHYLDSGALYRLAALRALRAGCGLDASAGVVLADLAGAMRPVFEGGRIRMDGEDVTDAIRAEAVGDAASRIAGLPAVRSALIDLQRRARRAPGLVADGRDMGTVIFPDAVLKVFLTASAESRAQRRHKQLIEKGFSANLSDLLRDLQARDARDSSRAEAPLKPAEGALVLDSTHLSVDQTTQMVFEAYGRLRQR
jgi:cytidylate kinase